VRPRVAIVAWGDLVADWLGPLGVSLEEFRDEFTGSWMFGYVDALRSAGVDTTIVGITSAVRSPETWSHRPSGARLRLLPPAAPFRPVARWMLDEPIGDRRDLPTLGRATLRHVAPYLATPVSRLARLFREERLDAVLCQEYETPRFDACVLAGGIARTDVFAVFQGGDYQDSRIERLLRPLTIRRAAGLIVPTSSEIARVRARYRVRPARIAQIFNPVDTDVWRPRDRAAARSSLGIGEDAVVAIWHGQVQLRRKGLDLLLDAWTDIERARPERELALLLVGSGADTAEVDRRIAAAGLRGARRIDRWVNDRSEMAGLLSAADVYVFPSRHEGFPLAPVEAMACGLPVVAADAQGVPDIFAAGEEHGGVVVARDDLGGLTHALGALIDGPDRRIALGQRARGRTETAFSVEAVGARLRSVLLGEPS